MKKITPLFVVTLALTLFFNGKKYDELVTFRLNNSVSVCLEGQSCGATSSASRMVFMSGTTGSGGSTTNRIDQINPMSSGNATSFGTLLNSRYRATASYGGGNNFDIYGNPNTTYNYTISGTVNSSDFDSYSSNMLK